MYIAYSLPQSTLIILFTFLVGVATYLKPSVAGFLLQKELDYLQGAVDVPKRPFAAIVGGSKVGQNIHQHNRTNI